jgi:hypothetical protein
MTTLVERERPEKVGATPLPLRFLLLALVDRRPSLVGIA